MEDRTKDLIITGVFVVLIILTVVGGAIYATQDRESAETICKEYNETYYKEHTGDTMQCYDSNGILHIREVKK